MSRRVRTAVDLLANLGWPWAVLTWLSGADALGPRWAPAVAMAAPLAHAAWRRFVEKRTSPIAVLVVVSIALNAAAGFLPLDAAWFAWKEALLPVGFGAVFAATAARGPGLVASLLDELLDRGKVDAALAEKGAGPEFSARLRGATFRFGAITAASGAVGGVLAAWMVRSPGGTEAFAAELGRYTAWSYLAVNLPVLVGSAWVLRDVLIALEDGTGRRIEELAPS